MWFLLAFTIGIGALAIYFARPVHLIYPVPSIWQHPDAVPGAWDRTEIFYCHKGIYLGGVFSGGRDYVMSPSTSLSIRQVNRAIAQCIEKGYRQLDLETYKRIYGLQNVV